MVVEFGTMESEGMDMDMNMDNPIEVSTPNVVNLKDVKEERTVLNDMKNVKLRISKCSYQTSKDGSVTKLNPTWELVDGFENDKGEVIFKGFKFYQDGDYVKDTFFTYIDYAVKSSEWWAKPTRFNNTKTLLKAVGVDVDGEVTFDDALLENVVGKTVIGHVYKVAKTDKNDNGEYVANGEYGNAVRYIKEVPANEMV